jgi:hypothetical protein
VVVSAVSVEINEFPLVLEAAGVIDSLDDLLLLVATELIARGVARAVRGEQKKDDA